MRQKLFMVAALLGASAPGRAQVAAVALPAAPGLSLPSARLRAIVAGSAAPRFDGFSSSSDAAPEPVQAAGMGTPAQARLVDAPLPSPPKPQPTALEKTLFWSTFSGYHAAFATDFTTTGMVIGRGAMRPTLFTRALGTRTWRA
jgi:hypothetical protein